MQGLADGYFIISYTLADFLASNKLGNVSTDHDSFVKAQKDTEDRIKKLLSIKGEKTVDELHRELGKIMWDYVGMSRNEQGLKKAINMIRNLREEFWKNVKVLGDDKDLNQALEKAGRVADFMELAELMAIDALHRNESCGGHFREEYQTEDNEAKRDDENFAYVAAWEFKELGKWGLHKEQLTFEYVKPTQRSYK